MTKKIITQCPNCSQQLSVPENIGGMLMACPSCGQKLFSDFKIRVKTSKSQSNTATQEKQSSLPQKPSSGFSVKV